MTKILVDRNFVHYGLPVRIYSTLQELPDDDGSLEVGDSLLSAGRQPFATFAEVEWRFAESAGL